jgi:hypothetical protein
MHDETYDIKKKITSSRSLKYGFYQFVYQFLGKQRGARIFGKGKQKFSAGLMEALKQSGKGKAIPVERRKNLSLEEFKNHYRRKGIPVVMEGAAKDWDCVKNWSLEYFKELHGKDVIALTNHKLKDSYETTTLGDVIDNIRGGGGKYYRFYPLLFRHPEHIRDFDYKWLLERRNPFTWFEAWHVFIGGKGTITPFHMENQCNLFVQVYGKKKWIIYPNNYTMVLDPDPANHMYRSPALKSSEGLFDAFHPDFNSYPEYQYINWLETELNPGDVLFNPCFNWHTVENETDSIGVGYRWVSPPYALKLAPLYAFLDLFMKNPSIFKSAKLYIEDTNLVRIVETGNLEKYLAEKKNKEQLQKV